jgi:predicted dehydrogenase
MSAAPLRAVVVGAGTIAPFWLSALHAHPDVEVVGLVEPAAAAAAPALEALGLPSPADESPEAALRRTGANLVVNLTPPGAHVAVVRAALEHGAHVFSEKPLAPSLAEAVALVELARARGRTLAVMQNYRWHPALRTMREAIAGGAIGAPSLVSADLRIAHFERAPYLRGLGHPLLLDVGIHAFDLARFLTGAEPVAVSAVELDPAGSPFDGPAVAACTFELEEGILFCWRGSFCARGRTTSYFGRWQVDGSEATLAWDGRERLVVEVATPRLDGALAAPLRDERLPATAPPDGTGHAVAVADALAALASGSRPPVDGADHVRSLAMVEAAIRSADERRRVPLSELLGERAP